MSDLHRERALIEKLVDGELDPPSVRSAEAHLETCEGCREHHAFLTALRSSARAMELPEPPSSYWERLPDRVLERLDTAERAPEPAGFWRKLFAPHVLRWEALVATAIVVIAVGATALRNDLLSPRPKPAAAPSPAETERSVRPDEAPPASTAAPPPAKELASPPVARDEALRDELESRADPSGSAPPESAKEQAQAVESLGYVAGSPAVAPAAPEPDVLDEAAPELAESVSEEEGLASAERQRAPARQKALPAASLRTAEVEVAPECDALRARVERGGEGEIDARFELARCSVRRYDAAPSPALAEIAIADAESFLSGEGQGARADEIRRALERMRR